MQLLKEGDAVIGYNLSNGQLLRLHVTADDRSWGNDLVRVNGGSLVLTGVDPPIYVPDETFTGWLRDPGALHVGDFLLDAVRNEWVPVWSLEWIADRAKVYDVVTDGPNNSIANGFLLDSKNQ